MRARRFQAVFKQFESSLQAVCKQFRNYSALLIRPNIFYSESRPQLSKQSLTLPGSSRPRHFLLLCFGACRKKTVVFALIDSGSFVYSSCSAVRGVFRIPLRNFGPPPPRWGEMVLTTRIKASPGASAVLPRRAGRTKCPEGQKQEGAVENPRDAKYMPRTDIIIPPFLGFLLGLS